MANVDFVQLEIERGVVWHRVSETSSKPFKNRRNVGFCVVHEASDGTDPTMPRRNFVREHVSWCGYALARESARAMRVAVDVRYVRRKPAGIGSYVLAIATRMPARAADIEFTYFAHPEFQNAFGAHSNLKVVAAAGDPQGPVTMFAPSRLFPIDECDVFHSPQNILGRGIRARTVVTVHDLMWLLHPHLAERDPVLRTLGAPFFGRGAKYALTHATRLIAVSRATADEIVRYDSSLSSRVDVIPNAVDPFFAPATDESASRNDATRLLGTDAPYFLVLGASQPYKDHPAALKAFAKTAKDGERLVLVQRRGPKSALFQLAVELGIASRVLWRESLTREEVRVLLQNAIALIHPSRLEGFGLPVLEAMACGCPVVATDIAALREVLGNAGSLAPLDDIASLGRALRAMADSAALREESREKGLLRAKAFDWDHAAEQTIDVYRRALTTAAR